MLAGLKCFVTSAFSSDSDDLFYANKIVSD